MIVGKKDIPAGKLNDACNSITQLKNYAYTLVPEVFRHITEIVDNQKYILAIEVRNLKTLPWRERSQLSEGLLEGVVVRGTLNDVIEIEDVLSYINFDAVLQTLFKRELELFENAKR